MARAFVIDWNPGYWNTPLVIKPHINYTGLCSSNGKNECALEFNSGVYTHVISYTTDTAKDARTLCRLAQRMSKFQLYCRLTNKINAHITNHGHTGITLAVLEETDYLNSLSNQPYHYQKLDDKNVPFNISEIDTKQAPNFKPCYFCQEYELQDEKGYPLHVVIMLEKANDGTEDNNLFKYKVKFVGSNQPLTKLAHQVPLCDDTAIYDQKCEDYRTSNQFYYDDLKGTIYDLIRADEFNKHFKTYDYETDRKWVTCAPVLRGVSCSHAWKSWGVGELECHYPKCQFYKSIVKKQHHDGQGAYNLFKQAFGQEIAELVKKGEFWSQHKKLMPDVSDPQFIKPFNKFLARERIYTVNPIRCFDNDGAIQKNKTALDKQIQQIQNWASAPTNGPLQVTATDGKVYTFPNPFDVKSKEQKTEEPTPQQKQTPDFQERKEKMQYRLMSRIKNPAILLASPGRIQITNVFDAPYMSEIAKDEYDTFTDIYVTYKKPQHKENQEITYRFKYEPLAYDLLDMMRNIQRLQGETGKDLKWAPAKLFPTNKAPATTDPKGLKIRIEEKQDVVTPVQTHKNYNGLTILNPQKMEPIACHHYELRTIDWGGSDYDSSEILLFNEKNQVFGIIHSRKPDTIIPKLIQKTR